MKAIVVTDQAAGTAGVKLVERPEPQAAINDVVIQIHASGFTGGAALVMPGLTAWQGLFEHGRLHAGQRVLVHGAAGVVGSMAIQLAREAGAYVIGTGRAGGRQTALDFGAQEFVDLDNDALEDVGEVDLVFDVIGGDIGKRSAGL